MTARNLFPVLFALLLGLASHTLAQTQNTESKPANAEEQARRAGVQWLQLIDTAYYEKAWDQSTSFLQNAVKQEAFSQTMRKMRQPLGSIKRRSLKEANYSSDVAGAPEGHYVVLQFTTRFADRSATEVLTMGWVDGAWKPVGYFVR